MSRISAALNSSNLSHEEHDCDVDVLQAAALSTVKSRTRSLGVLIIEAMEGSAGEGSHAVARLRDLQAHLEHRVKSWSMKAGLKVNSVAVSSLLVKELILDLCVKCQGRGFIPMKYDGSRLVAVQGDLDAKDVECNLCLGSGKGRRDYQARSKAAGMEYGKHLADWWESLLSRCADAEAGARGEMWRRLNKP